MQGVEVQLASAAAAAAAWQAALHQTRQQEQLQYQSTGPDSILVLEWQLPSASRAQQQQQQQQQETAGVHLVGQGAAAAPSVAQRGVAVTRRLLLQSQEHWPSYAQQQQRQQQQQFLQGLQEAAAAAPQRHLLQAPAVPANASAAASPAPAAAAAPSSSRSTPADAPAGNDALWDSGGIAALGAAYPKNSCFADFPGFYASDITTFVRLIKDPAVTRIELTNSILFTEELFPPEHANNQSLGINVTHSVSVRCLVNG
jgi:hypothetical protein